MSHNSISDKCDKVGLILQTHPRLVRSVSHPPTWTHDWTAQDRLSLFKLQREYRETHSSSRSPWRLCCTYISFFYLPCSGSAGLTPFIGLGSRSASGLRTHSILEPRLQHDSIYPGSWQIKIKNPKSWISSFNMPAGEQLCVYKTWAVITCQKRGHADPPSLMDVHPNLLTCSVTFLSSWVESWETPCSHLCPASSSLRQRAVLQSTVSLYIITDENLYTIMTLNAQMYDSKQPALLCAYLQCTVSHS